MMKFSIVLTFILTSLILVACKTDQTDAGIVKGQLNEIDSISKGIESQLIDTVDKKNHEIKEQKQNLAKIEKKYGEQWDFCKCVLVNDSINKAIQDMENFDSPEAEKLLERLDFVSKKCQAFLGMDSNRTPEERLQHTQKVKNCLKQAGVK